MRRRVVLATGVLMGTSAMIRAQAWPARPIRMILTAPPGSSIDLLGRLIADKLRERLGQPVIAENRPQAGGTLGTDAIAKADKDGHTIGLSFTGPLTTAQYLYAHLPYDPVRDLVPIVLVGTAPNLLAVNATLPVETFRDFVQYARQRPGQLNYASIGNGSASHLAMELFKTRAGLDIVHVPYQGFPQVVNAILAGQVQAGFMVPGIAMGQVRAGKLKALAVTTLGRAASLPEYPTFVEQGYADFEAISWQAVLAPARTPQAVIERMARELVRIIKSDEVRGRMLGQYFSAAGTAPQALAGLMQSERERWARVIRAAGVKPE
jgi:tripartite-type tricarboxylate transporter receptor subunit TctC